MAFQKLNTGDIHFIADTREDLKALPPCSIGSTCYIVEDNSKWIVNSKGVWFCQNAGSGGGGVINPDSPNPESGITAEEIAAIYLSKEQAKATLLTQKYEISNKPKEALVDYREKEIRIMCPKDTVFNNQLSGENADPNSYYIGFKAYAPSDEVVSFKEDDLAVIEDQTMYYFENNDFAGIDTFGRKYSIVWLPIAYKNSDGSWTYYGANSNETKMIGWYYSVEWYDKDQKIIGMDKIRINLTNEKCHTIIEPYYIAELNDGNAVWASL